MNDAVPTPYTEIVMDGDEIATLLSSRATVDTTLGEGPPPAG